jgi:hypothetical protein
LKVESFPPEVAQHPGWYDTNVLRTDGALMRDAASLVASLQDQNTVFLVEHSASTAIDDINAHMRRALDGHGGRAPELLYAAGPDPNAKPTFSIMRYRFGFAD